MPDTRQSFGGPHQLYLFLHEVWALQVFKSVRAQFLNERTCFQGKDGESLYRGDLRSFTCFSRIAHQIL